MNIKAVLFDIDGVMIRPPNYFGEELEKQGYKIAQSILAKFFANENTACTTGKKDETKAIEQYLNEFGWNKTVEDFFQEQFEYESQFFDQNFIELIGNFKEQKILCFIASAQEKVRAKYFLNFFHDKIDFDGSYISSEIGYRKSEPKYWNYVILDLKNKYNVHSEEILFIDDSQKNLDMAQNFGIQVQFFTSIKDIKKYVTRN